MRNTSFNSIYLPLWITYGVVPLVAGLDKFTNLLVDWEIYLAPIAAEILPFSPDVFMWIVGIIEIVAGVAVLTRLTHLFAYVVAAWLTLIALNLIIAGYYDIAVRDLAMAVGAYTLGRVAAMRGEPILPGIQAKQPELQHAPAT